MMSTIRVGLPAFAALAVVGMAGAVHPQQRPQPAFRTSSELVVVDLVAVDAQGRFITDLRPEEIEVREDGRVQQVQLLRLFGRESGSSTNQITPPGSPAPGVLADSRGPDAEPDRAPRRLLIVIDTLSLPVDAVPRIREALLKAFDDLPAAMPVMLATIDRRLVVRQPFTTDRQAMAAAVSALSPDAATRAPASAIFEAVDRICAAADQRRVFEAAIDTGETFIVEANARSAATSSALENLLTGIGTVDGRKHLVFYSAGHAISPAAEAAEAVAAAVSGCTGADPMATRRQASAALGRFSTRQAAEGLRAVINRANRAQTTFYTLDPSAISTDTVLPESRGSSRVGSAGLLLPVARLRNDGGRDYVEGLAQQTGGLSVKSNDLDEVLKRAWEDAAQYYLVGYKPPPADSKAAFRKLTLSVKRSAVDVRYRKGYFAWSDAATKAEGTVATAAASPLVHEKVGVTSEARLADARTADVVALAARYVDQFVGRFSNVVIEEKLEQTLTAPPERFRGSRTASPGMTTHRRLVSDFLLVRPTGTAFWIPFRDVVEVDGRALTDRPDRLMRLFVESGASGTAQAMRIAAAGAAHQLGPRSRTTTNPVITLAFLQPHHQHRFNYSLEQPKDSSSHMVTVRFNETGRPTLMRTDDGQDLPMRGSFEIDTRTGAVVASELVLRTFVESVVLHTRYAYNEGLQVHIPSEMRETYLSSNGAKLQTVAQ